MFKDRRSNTPIDELWLHVMLAAIGETLEKEGENEVTGVVINIRRGYYRIAIWTRSTGGPLGPGQGVSQRTLEQGVETLTDIGRKFKDVLRLPPRDQVEFIGHTESSRSGTSRAGSRFVV